MSPVDHAKSFLSFLVVTLNLLIWLPALLLTAVFRVAVPTRSVNTRWRLTTLAYRIAVMVNTWWLTRILNIRFVVEDQGDVLGKMATTDCPVILCNHRSWFDVFLLQTLVCHRGPILTFLIKSELVWVPVLGWVCLALDFPRLKRKGDETSRRSDLEVVRSVSAQLTSSPGALLIFPEGTRFTESKRDSLGSPYELLLAPRPGGFNAILSSIPKDTRIVDITIRYQRGDDSCWRCMSGAVDEIHVRVVAATAGEITDPVEWLAQTWAGKDRWLAIRYNKSRDDIS